MLEFFSSLAAFILGALIGWAIVEGARTLGLAKLAAQAKLEAESELWVVCYLHNWDPAHSVTGLQPVYPEVHSIHKTWKEAEAERASKINPNQYWVRRGRLK